jgi:hypothetical protein
MYLDRISAALAQPVGGGGLPTVSSSAKRLQSSDGTFKRPPKMGCIFQVLANGEPVGKPSFWDPHIHAPRDA